MSKKLISNLLVVNRHRRYTAVDVLCDPFILTVGGSQPGGDNLDELRNSRRSELEHRAKQNRLAFKHGGTTRRGWRGRRTFYTVYHLIGTLKPQSNRRLYSNVGLGTLAVDRWTVTFGTARRGSGRAVALPSPLIAVPNVTAHPSTASVPTSYYSIWHYKYLCLLKG